MKEKFDFKNKDNIVRIEGWARDGWEDRQIAKQLGYNETYFCELKLKHPELADALKRGRAPLDIIVETSLYKRAVGMKRLVQTPIKVKDIKYSESGRKISETERIEIVTTEENIPPDTTSMIFWLKNRKPKLWNIQPTRIDTTSNGEAIGRFPVMVDDSGLPITLRDDITIPTIDFDPSETED